MSTFGEKITEIRLQQGKTLRQVWLELSKNGSILTSSQYSKIERGIQNPRNLLEFQIIMKTLGVTDSQIIKELEQLALSKSRIVPDQIQAIYPPSNIKTEEEYEKIINFLNESDKPDW